MLAGRSPRSPAREKEATPFPTTSNIATTAGLISTRSPMRTPLKSAASPLPLTPQSQTLSQSRANSKRLSLSRLQQSHHHHQGHGQNNPFSFAAHKGKSAHPEKIDFFE
jgi:hypothetical protein